MKTHFNDDWKQWIQTNVNAGRDKNGIFKILLDEGYHFDTIAREMNFVPTRPVSQLINPLRATKLQNLSKTQHGERSKTAYRNIPTYHPVGFEKTVMAPQLFNDICAFYNAAHTMAEEEFVPGDFIVNQHQTQSTQTRKKSSLLIDLPSTLRQSIHDYMMPIMSEWCGKPLEPTYVYGIRTYLQGAKLKCHRDRIETHIISAIINVAQTVNEPWPLEIDDHQDRAHQVYLEPGEMIFYEGAKLRHGRPRPFNGQAFSNIFCHFKPMDYSPPA